MSGSGSRWRSEGADAIGALARMATPLYPFLAVDTANLTVRYSGSISPSLLTASFTCTSCSLCSWTQMTSGLSTSAMRLSVCEFLSSKALRPATFQEMALKRLAPGGVEPGGSARGASDWGMTSGSSTLGFFAGFFFAGSIASSSFESRVPSPAPAAAGRSATPPSSTSRFFFGGMSTARVLSSFTCDASAGDVGMARAASSSRACKVR